VIVFQTNGAPNASRQLGSLRCRLGKLRLFSMSRTPMRRAKINLRGCLEATPAGLVAG
jgi:hypothetical protein